MIKIGFINNSLKGFVALREGHNLTNEIVKIFYKVFIFFLSSNQEELPNVLLASLFLKTKIVCKNYSTVLLEILTVDLSHFFLNQIEDAT